MELSLLHEGRQHEKELVRALKKSTVRYGNRTLGQFDDNELLEILGQIKAIIPEKLRSFTRYYVYQVAKGYLPLHRISEDSIRMSNTIEKFRLLSRTRRWDASHNIFDFDDWRKLEQAVHDKEAVEYDTAPVEEHSKILFTKRYVDKHAVITAELLEQPLKELPWVQFWLRHLLTAQGAYKYGRGTMWCTATDPKNCPPEQHPFTYYRIGLYVIEKATNSTPRHPIAQVSGSGGAAGKSDKEVAAFRGRLKQFVRDALQAVGQQIEPYARGMLERML